PQPGLLGTAGSDENNLAGSACGACACAWHHDFGIALAATPRISPLIRISTLAINRRGHAPWRRGFNVVVCDGSGGRPDFDHPDVAGASKPGRSVSDFYGDG